MFIVKAAYAYLCIFCCVCSYTGWAK